MSVEQAVFALAVAASLLGALAAVAHRDPRVAGIGLLLALLGVAALYASLAAPVLAAAVLLLAILATVPLAVHLTVASTRVHERDDRRVAIAAAFAAATLLVLLVLAVAFGEVPLNVSLRSTGGYELGALGELLAGRYAVPSAAAVAVLLAALVGIRAARPPRRPRA